MESAAYYENLAQRRAQLPVLAKPADPKRGSYRRCGRCKGTGEACYNHLNGDTYCYLCDGRGWQLVYSAAEKATIEAERKWWGDAHRKAYDMRLQAERVARKAEEARRGYVYHRTDSPEDPEREATRKLARRTGRLVTFWIGEGLEAMYQ